jgi:hypothetical protein
MVTSTRPRSSRLQRFGDTGAWIAFVVVLAICGAGLILTFDHPQNDAGRPELTARGDSIVEPRLAALAPMVAQLSADANAISQQARTLYGHVRERDTQQVQADVTAGDQLVTRVAADLAPIEAARTHLTDGTDIGAISASNRAQVLAINAAATAAEQLNGAWKGITNAATRVVVLVDALAQHDAAVLDATSRARNADYSGALASLETAKTALDLASTVADAAGGQDLDTSTLRSLIDRNASYDAALTTLYTILAGNGGVMTADAQQAFGVVQQAQAALPDNDTAMTVIVSDIGGDQVTLGMIALDQLRGTIATAVPEPAATSSPG